MFHRFLKAIQDGDVQSLTEIARKLDVSQEMILRIAKDLTKLGYLQEITADCSEPQKGCSDCPVNGGCQVSVRHWFLTEKGKTAAACEPNPDR